MPIKTKRWNDPEEPDDGFRLLVCRYRPRGVRKEDETWDAWWPELGPSRALHAARYGKHDLPIDFPTYEARYLSEMTSQVFRIRALAKRAEQEIVTLLCSSACVDAHVCHRMLLARILARMAAHSGKSL